MAAGRQPTHALTAAPFDQITFDDLRVIRICGQQWASLAGMTIAEAISTAEALPLSPVLAAAAPALTAWATQVATATLDELAAELVAVWETARQPAKQIRRRLPRPMVVSSPPLDAAARRAAIARFGLNGQQPATLEQAAQTAGLSRERVRQVTGQIHGAANRWIWAPTLDRALQLADHAFTAGEYTATIAARGLTDRPWHPAAIVSLARLCGRTPPQPLIALATPSREPTRETTQIWAAASALINQRCLAPLAQIADTAATALGQPVAVDQVRKAIVQSDQYVLAGDRVGPRRARPNWGRLPHVTVRLLALAEHIGGTVTVELVHAGLERRLRQRGIRTLPSITAISAYLAAHPDFTLHKRKSTSTAVVKAVRQVPAVDELFAAGTLAMIDIILASPGKFISREELLAKAQQAGVGRDAACQILLYNEALTRHSHRLWTLAGIDVGDNAAAAARATLRDNRPSGLEGVTDDGRPWWAFTVTTSLLTYVRQERRTLAQHPGHYRALDHQGNDVGIITVHDSGRMTGLRTYVHRHQPPIGARLRVRLELDEQTVVIEPT